MDPKLCASCAAPLKGEYCSQCGEKVVDPPRDYSMIGFLEQMLEGVTNFDIKIFRTFFLLIRKPGFLTLEYEQGRRKNYMKPIQVFAICSLLFYLIFPEPTSFYVNVEDLVNNYGQNIIVGNIFQYDMGSKLKSIEEARKISRPELIHEIHREASDKSKLFLFLIIPFWGMLVYLLMFKVKPYLFQNLIFVTHCLSVFILMDMAFISIFKFLKVHSVGDKEVIVLLIIFLVYVLAATKRFYELNAVRTILSSLLIIVFFMAVLITYRQSITLYTVLNGFG